jgi:DMSO reductase family type II enzyme heme b subunit
MPGYQAALTEDQIWNLIHYVQTLPKPGAEERSRHKRLLIAAKKTKEISDLNPLDPKWQTIQAVFVPLMPLWWRDDRVEGVQVRALYDEGMLEVHLTWTDSSQNDRAVGQHDFSDGAAIQFSSEKDPPVFSMGSEGSAVDIWHWKASWQKELSEWEDVETKFPDTATDWYESQTGYEYGSAFETSASKTQFHDPAFLTASGAGNPVANLKKSSAVEEAQAKGFGSLTTVTPETHLVEAKGVWQDGSWNVVFRRALKTDEQDRISMKRGGALSIAFAVWDGSREDRNGQKMVSIWDEFRLER